MKADAHYITDFYQKNYQKAVRLAQSFVSNIEQAEDIASDAILKLIEMGDTLNEERNISGLFNSIIRNKCLDYLRREQRRYKVYEELQKEPESTKIEDGDRLYQKELKDTLHTIISTLPQDTRKIFIAVRLQGKSYREVSEIMGLSNRVVEYRLRKTEEHFKKLHTYIYN